MSPRRLCLVAAVLLAATAGEVRAQICDRACVGPQHGAIMAAGGGELGLEVYEEFVKLAGGSEARIVLIPTAGARYGSLDGWKAIEELRQAGVEHMEILHTRSSDVAELESFSAPLREATGVWFSGGRQYRLVDVYLNTRTHHEVRAVLERGGVVGGNSAGASALASFLIRGSEDGNEIVDPTNNVGFGFLHDVAVDQHLLARGRENDLIAVLKMYPHLLGIGLDEGSAIVVTRDLARVIGNRVAIYDFTDPLSLIPLWWLKPGDVYDLGSRRVVLADEGGPGN
jgi:cyanophycinase